MATTAAAIRAALRARIVGLSPTTGYRADDKFRPYLKSGSLRWANPDAARDRVFQVEIGPASRFGAEDASEVQYRTLFRVVVLYKVDGDVEALEDRISDDRILLRNVMRYEGSDMPALEMPGDLPEPNRSREDWWVLVLEGEAQHTERQASPVTA